MSKFNVFWCKTYVASGYVVVDADDSDHAEAIVHDEMGDYTGSMQYVPDEDWVECYEEVND